MAFVVSSFRTVLFSASTQCSSITLTDRWHTFSNIKKRSVYFSMTEQPPQPVPSSPISPSPSSTKVTIAQKPQEEVVYEIAVDLSGVHKTLSAIRSNTILKSVGIFPVFFVACGILVLAFKMFKRRRGQISNGQDASNKITSDSDATLPDVDAELRVFQCGGCGYEMCSNNKTDHKPFPNSFKCPLCGTSQRDFINLSNVNDLHIQTSVDGSNSTNSISNPKHLPSTSSVQTTADDASNVTRRDIPQT